jgi:hypothetical protein
MRPDDLLSWVKAVPFVPFRIRLNSGRTFDIPHPEMLKVGRTTFYVFSYVGDGTDVVEKMEMVSPLLVESVEPMEKLHSA